MQQVVVCIDDTDDVTKSTSTGKVAGTIADACASLGGRIRLGTTRHQLLLSPDVPYTSHNSSMCFEAELPDGCVEEFRRMAAELLVEGSVPAADPGLCVAVLPQDGGIHGEDGETAGQIAELIAFGKRAKVEYCSKESAYALAASIPWVHLSEHGGSGQGIVGALAGVGLRLSGNDGRFRGAFDLPREMGFGATPGARKGKNPGDGSGDGSGKGDGSGGGSGAGRGKSDGRGKGDGSGGGRNKAARAAQADAQAYSPHFALAKDVAAALSRSQNGPVRLSDTADAPLAPDTPVYLQPDAKAVFRGGSLTLICRMECGVAIPCTKDLLSDTGDNAFDARVCANFAWDNDAEEIPGREPSCRNCLHRRWEAGGFSCMLENAR